MSTKLYHSQLRALETPVITQTRGQSADRTIARPTLLPSPLPSTHHVGSRRITLGLAGLSSLGAGVNDT